LSKKTTDAAIADTRERVVHVAGSGVSLVQMGNANLNPWTEAKVNTKNHDRGPLLIIEDPLRRP